jgi:hypothetical protein
MECTSLLEAAVSQVAKLIQKVANRILSNSIKQNQILQAALEQIEGIAIKNTRGFKSPRYCARLLTKVNPFLNYVQA